MKQTVNVHDFRQAFADYNRQDNFTYNGLTALFDYVEQYEEDTGQEFELDVIGLCCDFTEYDSLEDIKGAYTDIESIDDLYDNTTVIEFGAGQYIIQDY